MGFLDFCIQLNHCWVTEQIITTTTITATTTERSKIIISLVAPLDRSVYKVLWTRWMCLKLSFFCVEINHSFNLLCFFYKNVYDYDIFVYYIVRGKLILHPYIAPIIFAQLRYLSIENGTTSLKLSRSFNFTLSHKYNVDMLRDMLHSTNYYDNLRKFECTKLKQKCGKFLSQAFIDVVQLMDCKCTLLHTWAQRNTYLHSRWSNIYYRSQLDQTNMQVCNLLLGDVNRYVVTLGLLCKIF